MLEVIFVLIMDKAVVKELIQKDMTAENISNELFELLNNVNRQQQIKNDYSALKKLLQEGGNASARAAQEIVGFMQTTFAPTA